MKSTRRLPVLLSLLLAVVAIGTLFAVATSSACAQDAAATSPAAGSTVADGVATALGAFLSGIVASHPFVATLIGIVGTLRFLFKPVTTLVEAYVKRTPSTADDAFVEKIEHSAAYRGFAYALDLIGSIKIGPQFTAKPGENAK